MYQIIIGRYVLTMNANLDVIENGAVVVEQNKIIEVGPSDQILPKYPEAKILNCQNHAVMPGLINAHTHAAMVYLRGYADDLEVSDWLKNYIWPAESKWLSPEFVYDGTELACLEMLKAGITTFADMYFFCDSVAAATKKIGLRSLVGSAILDFPNANGQNADENLQNAEQFIQKWQGDDLITPSLAPHAIYSCNTETLKKARILANKFNSTLQLHVAETEWEVSTALKQYGKRQITYLNDIGFLDGPVLAVHCVWINDDEIAILKQKQVGVADCIESNLKLASGFAPIPKMLEQGVKVAIGTDGAASNNSLDILGDMNSIGLIYKAVVRDPTAVGAKTVVKMATCWGAEVLGFKNLGRLEKDCLADIITIDLHKPHLVPIYDIYSHLVYAANGADVANVMVNGKLLMKNRIVCAGEEDHIIDKAIVWNKRIAERRLG